MTRTILVAAAAITLLLEAPIASAQSEPTPRGRDDALVELEASEAVNITVNGNHVDTRVTGGSVSIQVDDPRCVPGAGQPCSYTINSLRIYLADAQVDGQTFTGVELGLRFPVRATDYGSGIEVPAGAASYTIVTMDGNRLFSRIATSSSFVIFLDLERQALGLHGTFAGSVEGRALNGVVDVAGAAPFVNVLPRVSAGLDQTVRTCGAQLTPLIGTATDPNGDSLTAVWLEDGAIIGFGLKSLLNLTPGHHDLTLRVNDPYGGQADDQISLDVVSDSVAPFFTSAPVDIRSSACTAVDLGRVEALDDCGVVALSNDAPAKFPPGVTEVTWTARDLSGNTATLKQRVTMVLADDASCCPDGSNVLIGTSNNDVISGTEGPDCILGLGGQDRINGLGGDDVISGGDGDDVIAGGGGNDLLFGGSGQDQLLGEAGDDLPCGGDGDDLIEGGDGADTLLGGQGQDRLNGGRGDDRIFGEIGDDTLVSGDGNDFLDGGEDHNTCIQSGAGSKTLNRCEYVR